MFLCSHPRGQEISTVISGPPFQFGLIEEDQANNTLILRNLTTLETIHIPQGTLAPHFLSICSISNLT